MKFKISTLLLFFDIAILFGQSTNELTFNEFIGYVKQYHPLVKQANLKISEAQAQLMKARGAFDPKIEASYTEKQFNDKNYYNILNGSLKIPTWFGVEIKAAFDNNEGIYLNPENTLPNSGLTSVGINIPLGQGLFINDRMADLKKAKQFQQLNQAEQNLLLTEVIYHASLSYINWRKSYEEVVLYENYVENAELRYKGVLKLIEEGDKPAIDSVEAGITVKSRQLNLENAKLKLLKTKLELSNYIWTENNIPLEIDDALFPEKEIQLSILTTLNLNNFEQITLSNHPKLSALDAKISILKIDKKLKANSILPKLDVSYNYLSEPSAFENYRFEDYKVGVNFSFPLFLRKERANLKLAKLKIQDSELSLNFEREQLSNKIEAQKQEVNSFKKQLNLNSDLVKSYTFMLNGEERLFQLGESSLFIINSRENSLVSSKLSNIDLEFNYLQSTLNLYKTRANPQ